MTDTVMLKLINESLHFNKGLITKRVDLLEQHRKFFVNSLLT